MRDTRTQGHARHDQAVSGKPKRRLVLPEGVAFGAMAAIADLAFVANSAASPLYRVYQEQFRFSAITLTLLFTVFIVVLLVTLLFAGSLSDYVGRRPVVLAGLVSGAAAVGLFLLAHGVGLLFGARALLGVAVALITGAAAAALQDLRPSSSAAPLLSSTAVAGGGALGAIGASALAQYAPAPTRLVWWILLGAFAAGALAVLAMAEPGTPRPGALSSLRPRVSVPRPARGAFVAAVPCLVGLWALVGFYFSLGPSLVAQLLHSGNLLWGGVVLLVLGGTSAAAAGALTKADPSRAMLAGCIALSVGALVTFAAIETGTPAALFLGTAVAGLGWGPAFMGAYRGTVVLVPSGQRAGLITAIYIVSYVALGTAVIGGVTTTVYGLHATALVYSVVVAGLTAAAAAILLVRRPGTAPGGCRVTISERIEAEPAGAAGPDAGLPGGPPPARPCRPGRGLREHVTGQHIGLQHRQVLRRHRRRRRHHPQTS
jgi:MFS family permease